MYKTQVIVVDGGHVFEDYGKFIDYLSTKPIDVLRYTEYAQSLSWKQKLGPLLGDSYQVFIPAMPNRDNAQYSEWKVWFERFLPFIEQEGILVGHSLGGTFLLKYLSENVASKNIKGLFLVAPAYSKTEKSSFKFTKDFKSISAQVPSTYLYHSKDDQVVPFEDLGLVSMQIPGSIQRIFEDRGHFNQPNFPEIVEDIKRVT